MTDNPNTEQTEVDAENRKLALELACRQLRSIDVIVGAGAAVADEALDAAEHFRAFLAGER